MRVVWSKSAIDNLTEIWQYIDQDKPEAARRLAKRILFFVQRLASHPYLGRAGREPDTRELIIGGTPYVVAYQIEKTRLVILAVLHSSRERATQNE